MRRLALGSLALLLLAALLGALVRPAGAADPAASGERSVTVTGSGGVSSAPDRAQLSFGVESQGATAKAALAANAVETRRLISALRAAGISELQTQTVSVSPRYGEDNRVLGFVATNTVGGVVDVSAAGAAIDAAVAAGANQIYGPSFTKEDADELYGLALELAVTDARARAESLARAAGGTLGRVVSVSESSAAPIPLTEKTAAADASTPIVPGEQETTATVTVTFALV